MVGLLQWDSLSPPPATGPEKVQKGNNDVYRIGKLGGQRAGRCEMPIGHQVPDECSKEHKLFKEKKVKSDSVIPTIKIKSKLKIHGLLGLLHAGEGQVEMGREGELQCVFVQQKLLMPSCVVHFTGLYFIQDRSFSSEPKSIFLPNQGS